jgi:hypothetical protein
MPCTASGSRDSWSALLRRLPTDLDLDTLARDTKAVQRRRGDGIGDGTTLFRLSLGHGPGGMSLQQAAAWASAEGGAEITARSLHERLRGSVAFLSAVLQRLLAARAAAPPRLWKGHCPRIGDASSLSQPGSKGTDWRLHAVYDLGRGGFSHLKLSDGHGPESPLRCEPAANEILIADRGYAKARQLLAYLDPAGPQQRDFIVRIGWKALVLSEHCGKPFSLVQQMQAMDADVGPQESAALTDRAGVQAADVAAAYRSTADPNRSWQHGLAAGPSHFRPADRRCMPGPPGLFPLWSLLLTAGGRSGATSS